MVKRKYIEFYQIYSTDRATGIWNIYSTSQGALLGRIRWYTPWRQYCFFPSMDTVFSHDCLDDISGEIIDLMQKKKKDNG